MIENILKHCLIVLKVDYAMCVTEKHIREESHTPPQINILKNISINNNNIIIISKSIRLL